MAFETLAHRAAARQPASLEHRTFEIATLGGVSRHEMELVGVALQRPHELDRIATLGEDTIECPIEANEVAIECRGDDVVDADRCGVTQNGHRVFQRDRFAGVGALVEQQLVDLAARLAAIAAQPLDDPFQRIGLDRHALGARRTLDQSFEGGLVVHVTGHGGQSGFGLGQGAQVRARCQVAALDDDQRIAGGRLDEVLQGRG